MEVTVVLLCAALLFAGGFVAAFVWAVRTGQYEDVVTPAARMVAEPDAPGQSPRAKITTMENK